MTADGGFRFDWAGAGCGSEPQVLPEVKWPLVIAKIDGRRVGLRLHNIDSGNTRQALRNYLKLGDDTPLDAWEGEKPCFVKPSEIEEILTARR